MSGSQSATHSAAEARYKALFTKAASSDEGAQSVFFIAEAGVNHNGNMDLAKTLIKTAASAGADAVKFQLFDPKLVTSVHAPLAKYQSTATADEDHANQQDMLAQLALSTTQFAELKAICEEESILFLCTPFDEGSATFLVQELQVPFLKVASGELTNIPFLEHLSGLNTPVILSTGMSHLHEVERAVQALHSRHPIPLAILHCVSAYPTPAEAVNLRAMETLQQTFPTIPIGFSDHTPGITISLAAAARGASIIEKHYTMDQSLPGPDHKASLTPEELHTLIRGIREVEQSIGHGRKEPHPVELDCQAVARRSVVLREALPAGHTLQATDFIMKRPASGIAPERISELIGRTLTQDCPADHILQNTDMSPALDTP